VIENGVILSERLRRRRLTRLRRLSIRGSETRMSKSWFTLLFSSACFSAFSRELLTYLLLSLITSAALVLDSPKKPTAYVMACTSWSSFYLIDLMDLLSRAFFKFYSVSSWRTASSFPFFFELCSTRRSRSFLLIYELSHEALR